MNRHLKYSVIAAGALLTACADQGMVYDASDPVVHISSFYSDGAAGRDLTLVVDGNPFSIPNENFARLVEADLKDNTIAERGPTQPLLTPGPSAKPLYRLVYVFEPRQGLYGDSICYANTPAQATPAAAAGPNGKVTAVAAFCVGYRALSYITGETEVDGPGDVRFYRLTRLMEDAVFRPDVRNSGPPLNMSQ